MIHFTPQVVKDTNAIYVTMLLEVDECPICKKIMMRKENKHFHGGNMPNSFAIDQDTQMKQVGIVFESKTKVDDQYICAECAEAGKADFLCSLCGSRYPTDQVQESFGDPPEHLCKNCYATVPAQQWDKKTSQLYSAHQYDHE